MGQIVLYPWSTVQRSEGHTGWAFGGVAGEALRDVADGKYAIATITLGMDDSNGLDGRDWRQLGGAVFSWLNRTPTNVKVEFYTYNNGPGTFFGLAAYIANFPQTWFMEIWNGSFNFPATTGLWRTLYTGNDSRALAAIKDGSFVASGIAFNHNVTEAGMVLDAYRITVDYSEVSPNNILWLDF